VTEALSVDQIVVVGKKRQGKSTVMLGRLKDRVIVCDTASWFVRRGVHSFGKDVQALGKFLLGHPKRFKVAVTPLGPDSFDLLCRLVWSAGPCLFVVDEIGALCPHRPPESLAQLIQMAGHRSIDLMFATTRPQWCSRSVTAGATEWYVFNVTGSRDVQYLENECEFGPEEIATIRGLDKYTCLHKLGDEPGQVLCVDRDGKTRRLKRPGMKGR
jgi:hypothetical protein